MLYSPGTSCGPPAPGSRIMLRRVCTNFFSVAALQEPIRKEKAFRFPQSLLRIEGTTSEAVNLAVSVAAVVATLTPWPTASIWLPESA